MNPAVKFLLQKKRAIFKKVYRLTFKV
jgi:hypothetical protein